VIALFAAAHAASGDSAVAVGWGTGVDARLGKGAVFVGVGGGPTVRLDVGEHWDAHAEARVLVLAGTAGLARVGVGAHLTKEHWRPGLGLDAALFVEPSLRAVTTENPTLAPVLAPVLELRLDPLRFEGARWTAEVLRVEVGSGWDRGQPAIAFGVTVGEVGITF
jgi:hypothetical protein